MANISAYGSRASLDWLLGGATPTRPTVWGGGLSLGSPTSVSGSEIATGSGYTRQTCPFAAAGTPSGSATATNASAMTFGPFSSAQSISGILVTDTLATGGNMLLGGLLTTARSVSAGDSLVVAAGALIISLS